MLVEVESPQLAERYTLAHEPETGYGFIGYSPRGLVLRVSWFDGATLQPPAPPRRRVHAGPPLATRLQSSSATQ